MKKLANMSVAADEKVMNIYIIYRLPKDRAMKEPKVAISNDASVAFLKPLDELEVVFLTRDIEEAYGLHKS